jgi:hypothetical protein
MQWQGKGEDRQLVEVMPLDHYELYSTSSDHRDIPGEKARTLLINLLGIDIMGTCEITDAHVSPIPHKNRQGWTDFDAAAGPVWRSWRLSIPRYVGPLAHPDIFKYFEERRIQPHQFTPLAMGQVKMSTRYVFLEKLFVLDWADDQDGTTYNQDGTTYKKRKREGYFLTTYRRHSGIGGYRVLLPMEGKEMSKTPIWRIPIEGTDRSFKEVSVVKIEKFYEEDQR